MAALVKAPLSHCVNITLKREEKKHIFLLLPCTNTDVSQKSKHFLIYFSITTAGLTEQVFRDIGTFSDIFGLPSKCAFFLL